VSAHAKISASQFHRIIPCAGSLALSAGAPRTTSVYAAEGTAGHEILHRSLVSMAPAARYVGEVMEVEGHYIVVTDEMAAHVQSVVDLALEIAGDDGVVMAEQRVCFARFLGVADDDAWGTADIIIARGASLTVIDFKYGAGERVDVSLNPQLMLYGLGAVNEFDGIAGDFRQVELIIAQPRAGGVSREAYAIDELIEWAEDIAAPAVADAIDAEDAYRKVSTPVWEEAYLVPGETQCRWCPAKGTCPALRAEVAAHVTVAAADVDEFQQVTDPKTFREPDLSRAMGAVGMIEDWCKAVRAEVERRLLAGTEVRGWKLVEGRQGARAWADAAAAEQALKGMRLKQDEMYDLKLISPTSAEKLLAKDSPRRWAKLQEFISRAPGKPSVAPASDARPSIETKPVADDFSAVEDLA
jgi:hypothetical protein